MQFERYAKRMIHPFTWHQAIHKRNHEITTKTKSLLLTATPKQRSNDKIILIIIFFFSVVPVSFSTHKKKIIYKKQQTFILLHWSAHTPSFVAKNYIRCKHKPAGTKCTLCIYNCTFPPGKYYRIFLPFRWERLKKRRERVWYIFFFMPIHEGKSCVSAQFCHLTLQIQEWVRPMVILVCRINYYNFTHFNRNL